MTLSWVALIFVWSVCLANTRSNNVDVDEQDEVQLPTVFIPLLVRNKAHTLHTFFGCFERLNYPKQRISLWIRSDHNVDNTTAMLQEWVARAQKLYHKIDVGYQQYPQRYSGESGPMDWPNERFHHLVSLRQQAMEEARKQWADYLFTVDADNFLEDPNVLLKLIHQDKTVISPVLDSSTMYSNFWGGMNENGYYKRTEMYVQILQRNITGNFVVPMVHSTVLISLKHSASKGLTYRPPPGYKGDLDDMLIFAYSAKQSGVPMYVTNTNYFGKLLVPTPTHDSLEDEKEQMLHVKLETIIERPPLPTSSLIYEPERSADKLGFDEIYMVNLKRRPLRRQRMLKSLEWLGIEARVFDAVDGKALTSDDLIAMGIDMLPGYRDPYSERVLTKGEIGCFLSHYRIWQEMVQKNYQQVMVLEDDVRFEKGFKPKLMTILYDVALNQIDWDLIYVGRKILNVDEEQWVHGVRNFVKPSYSYWTLSYMLSLKGAKKLLVQEPLGRMVPVDEYLPIMFDKHPEKEWASAFWPRDLKAFSVNPLLVQPTHYVGDNNYFSDTETSNIWEDVIERENGRSEEKKGDPAMDEASIADDTGHSIQEHFKTPTANPKSDSFSSGFNNTGHIKSENAEQEIERNKPSITTEAEKIPKNEKAAESIQQTASTTPSSKRDTTERRHAEL